MTSSSYTPHKVANHIVFPSSPPPPPPPPPQAMVTAMAMREREEEQTQLTMVALNETKPFYPGKSQEEVRSALQEVRMFPLREWVCVCMCVCTSFPPGLCGMDFLFLSMGEGKGNTIPVCVCVCVQANAYLKTHMANMAGFWHVTLSNTKRREVRSSHRLTPCGF